MSYAYIIEELTQILRDFFSVKTDLFQQVLERMFECLKSGQKILVFGNGGSAAQAQHFAAELVNKFLKIRDPLRAVALTTDTSTLTSIANDSSYDRIFSRQIEALGGKGDIALGLSTSGNSPSVIEALITAKQMGLITIVLSGKGGGNLASLPDYLLDVPSQSTPRIQEAHLFLLHLLAEELEERVS